MDVNESLFDEHLAASPFARQALYTLASGLKALHEIVSVDETSPTNRQVNESVGEGVSYELCAALASVLRGKETTGLDVSFSWARRYPLDLTPQPIKFTTEVLPILDRVSDQLRGTALVAEQTVLAYVRSSKRDANDDNGTVGLRSISGDDGRYITAVLSPDAYAIATEANVQRKPILVRGTLEKETGRSWRFRHVAEIRSASTLNLDDFHETLGG